MAARADALEPIYSRVEAAGPNRIRKLPDPAAAARIVTSIYALVRLAGRIYSHGLLHSGPRLTFHTAWLAVKTGD